jgi:hypothetical protein
MHQNASRLLRFAWGRLTGAPDFSIIVFQMGKVGSRTVYESLVRAYRKRHQPVDIYHSHILCNFDNSESVIRKERPNPEATLAEINAGRELRQRIDESPEQQWRIITLVRDPIARNVGTFFQVLDEHIPHWKERYSANVLTVEDIQTAFLNARSIHSEPVRWFDEQLLPVFGVDVFSEPFPRETGYKIYNLNSRAPVLLIRLEDLNRIGALAMYEFLGLEDFEIFSTNIGDEKEYAELYRLFKTHPLPHEYVREMYSTKYAQTFYTKSEIERFTLKWMGASKPIHHPDEPLSIIVYQMGKVGSKTIEHSLRHYCQSRGMNVDVYHAHFLNYLEEMENNALQQKISKYSVQYIHEMMALREKILHEPHRKWRLISLVRDPVARNIAAFFQGLSVNQFIPDWKIRYQQGVLKVEELLEKFLSLGDDYRNHPATWFDTQLKPVFGIDVFETPFPYQKGYQIYQSARNASLLVIRLEDLNSCASRAMLDYLGWEDFTLLNSNQSQEKDYVNLYNEFKHLPLPSEYVDKVYDTKYAKHFYSESELKTFREKWTTGS